MQEKELLSLQETKEINIKLTEAEKLKKTKILHAMYDSRRWHNFEIEKHSTLNRVFRFTLS